MPPVLAFNEDLFRDVLRAFDNLDERAEEKANEFFNKYPLNHRTPIPAMSRIGLMIIA